MLISEKAAAVAPINELKAFLKVEDGTEDALLAGLLRAATEAVEAWLGWLLIVRDVTKRVIAKSGGFPLRATPVQAMVAAARVQADGMEIALAADQWALEVSRFGMGSLAVFGIPEGEQVVVTYRAGLAEDWNGLPEPVRLGVLRAAAHFFAHRDGTEDCGLPPAVARLVSPWRVKRLK